MSEKHAEWLKQANYDMDTADAMFSSGRYFYSVFMCHFLLSSGAKFFLRSATDTDSSDFVTHVSMQQ